MSTSSSPETSPSSSNKALTPSRKVKALLDGFSDSESDRSVTTRETRKVRLVSQEAAESSSDDDFLPRSRIASRFAREANPTSQEQSLIHHVPDMTESTLQEGRSTIESPQSEHNDDAIPFAPRRRLLTKKKSSPIHVSRDGSPQKQSTSPMNAQSQPANVTESLSRTQQQRETSSSIRSSPTQGKAKFLALVEKHRKERIAREADDIINKAAGVHENDGDGSTPPRKRQRGSSPADDSEEDSDASIAVAAKKLSRESRPIRKASKRALDEMNRETQRISRNMQLAHQARTKKRVTKESLLARFNLGSSDNEAHDAKATKLSNTSSVTASDDEHRKQYETPPTSPLQEPQEKHNAIPNTGEAQLVIPAAISDEEEMFDLKDILENGMPLSIKTQEPSATVNTDLQKKSVALVQAKPKSSTSLSARVLVQSVQVDSDSDLEVVTDKGLKRKFVAFETLSKKKAKEVPSHIALRSLANLMGDEKKRAMSTAGMEAKLRKAAREQAREERQAKIEMLKSKGVIVQTAEEREREQQEVEDLVERARQEAVEIQKREKALAKKNGTFVKDTLDEDESDDEEDGDFEGEDDEEHGSGSEDEGVEEQDDDRSLQNELLDEAAEEESGDEELSGDDDLEVEDVVMPLDHERGDTVADESSTQKVRRTVRNLRIVSDDEDEDHSMTPLKIGNPLLYSNKTPQSIVRSAKKTIPGLQMSDDLPLGLTQAFAATMADSQTQDEGPIEEQDSLDIMRSLPSPFQDTQGPGLHRIPSIDMISESVPASQTQPLDVNLSMTQSERVPESPILLSHVAASQGGFDLTQDEGYSFSPFTGNRFSETPSRHGVVNQKDTSTIQAYDDSPVVQRKSRLVRGKRDQELDDGSQASVADRSAFNVMRKAAKKRALQDDFNRKKSEARGAVDDAAEESDDEYAGLGGASDEDSNEEENEDDRKMIDEDTQIGKGDEAKLAQLHADRERQSDEAAVSKLLKDITTGALRRKRGVGDDLDLSDEEDATARRREAKRREFAKMRRELLKDEAVNKIAEDKRKEAFLRSIEDRDHNDEDEDNLNDTDTAQDAESQSQSQQRSAESTESVDDQDPRTRPLRVSSDSQLNQLASTHRYINSHVDKKPATLAEIRQSVSFLIEEPDSQAATIDLGLSDSEDEEAYVNLDRHFDEAEADENALDEEADDLGDFIVDDEDTRDPQSEIFKKPDLPLARTQSQERAPYTERRTKNTNVVDRLSLIRQASSTSSNSSASSRMAFFTNTSSNLPNNRVPNLLRRATTNSSLGSMSGRDISATGVVTNRTERGSVGEEKEFVRKGSKTNRNAVNYQARTNVSLREEKMSARAGVQKSKVKGKKSKGGFLGGLFRGDSWN